MPEPTTRRAWLMWGLGALFYAYGFFQRVAPGVMVEDLMRDFAISGAVLGSLSAAYFYAYAAVQVPVGVLLDRFGPRNLLSGAALLAAIGGLAFALAGSLPAAALGRALIGLGVGFAYISTLKLASIWFPPHRFGLVVGLTLAAGTLGAMVAQVPLAALLDLAGWRAAMTAVAVLGLGLAVLMLLFLRDRPAELPPARPPAAGMLTGLGQVIREPATWQLTAATGLIGAPLLAFAGLWGVPYLEQVEGLTRVEAGLLTSAMLAAWAVGGPACGWLSDRLGRRRPVLVGGATAMAVLWLPVLLPGVPLVVRSLAFIALGVAAGSMVVAFAAARDRFGNALAGSAMGVINSAVLLCAAAMQTLVGLLLDLRWEGTMAAGAPIYGDAAWRMAFLAFPVSGMVAAVAAALSEESGKARSNFPL
jgi:MFS family permease